MSEKRNPALIFIFITVLIDCIGIGLIVPVVPKLIEELTGQGLSVASQYGGWLTFAYAVMQFVCAPILGGLSDQYGRRPVLLISLFGLGLDFLVSAYSPTIGWLFFARVAAGICGASFTTASAYIADVSTPEKRAQNFGLIGAAFGLGFIIGPTMGALFSSYSIRAPFYAASILSLLNWLYGYFVLPESLSLDNRRPFSWKRANPVGSFRALRRYRSLIGLIVALAFLYIAGQVMQSIWGYFTMLRFGWDTRMVGISLGLIGLAVAIVQGGLIRLIIPKIGQKRAVFLGMAVYVISFLGFAFANESWMAFALIIPYSFAGITGPAIQGIISGHVPPNEQGELQGALASLMSLTAIVSPVLITNLFAYFTKPGAPIYFPGAPYMAGAVFTLVSLFITVNTLKGYIQPAVVPKEPVAGSTPAGH
ncbi:TCR/Tet family MFS transporter [Fibrivirga algicola]|uniref:TCR/Tet family MFS transporter n=1 Tax=Fibrivirga algicola TaxID=2950420 RepID=A0ABX0QCR1_9BACT|nr:TCR/Tet family MFS transporter [Fibrivirga algicola]NID09916.1 TCR/Tet family MFS transporter [Fibrivirga algicola]